MGISLPILSNPHLQANARWFAALTAWPTSGHDKDNRDSLALIYCAVCFLMERVLAVVEEKVRRYERRAVK